jgi:hypothetical protein
LQLLSLGKINWGRTLKKALQSDDHPTEFVKCREISADRNQRRAACDSKMPSATKEKQETSELIFDTARYPHEYKIKTEIPDEQTKRTTRYKKYTQSDQLA